MRRGELWWASLSDPLGSAPGFRRPVLVIQCDPFNESRINTVVVAAVTSNLRLAKAPGNVLLDAGESNLPRNSDGNPDSPQVVVFLATIVDVTVGS